MDRKVVSLLGAWLPGAALVLALVGIRVMAWAGAEAAVEAAAETGTTGAGSPWPLVTSYPLPEGQDGAPGRLLEAAGRFWFTAPGINALGALEVAAGGAYTYTFYPIPTDISVPYDLAWDGENIWFTELAGNKLGKFHVASEGISEYPLETADSEPSGIAWDAAGLVWFVERAGNRLGAFDPAAEQFSAYPYPSAGGLLEDVAVHSAKDWVWFTAPGTNRLVLFDTATEQIELEVPTSAPFVAPYTPSQVAVDDAGNPWVSTLEGRIGRYAATTLQFFRWYRVGPEDSRIEGLSWTNDGRKNQIWFTESNTGYAGQLRTDANGSRLATWRFPVTAPSGAPDGHLAGLVVSAAGSIWMAAGHTHELLQWSPPYVFSTHLPVTTKQD